MNNLVGHLDISEPFGALEFPTFKKIARSIHDHVIPHERNNYHPHILSHRLLALFSILVVSIKVASISFIVLTPASTTLAAAITNETIVSLANSARVEGGLPELTTSSLLSKAADNKAKDMLARQYFSHNTPDGATPWSFIKAVGYSYSTAGENLAIDYTDASSVQTAWMNSPGHRANIMNKNFTQIGIGIAQGTYDNHQTIIVVQMFGTPLNAPVTIKDTPTQVASKTAPASPAPVVTTPAAPQSTTQPASQPAEPQPVAQQPIVQTAAPVAPTEVEVPINIIETKTAMQGDKLYLEVQATANAVKALAFYGTSSTMLDPLGNGLWSAAIPASALGPNTNLIVQVADINGKMHQQSVAEFSHNLNSTNGNVEGAQITVFGTSFNPKIWEQKTLMLILAGLLTALLISIAVKRHVQHLSLVANTSFVAMLIAMLLIV